MLSWNNWLLSGASIGVDAEGEGVKSQSVSAWIIYNITPQLNETNF